MITMMLLRFAWCTLMVPFAVGGFLVAAAWEVGKIGAEGYYDFMKWMWK